MTTFRHTIGRSTLTEGIAVPKSLEDWVQAPALGQKRQIVLLFDDQSVPATLRRLGNARGHVQIKYENRDALPFRKWLASTFSVTQSGMEGEYLELSRVEGDAFRVIAWPLGRKPMNRLVVEEWILHRTDEQSFRAHSPVREIPAIVQSVAFNADEGQSFYNQQLSQTFTAWDWDSEKRVIPQLPLKTDFAKGPVHVEVEFGNARTYYQDYVKFLLAFNRKVAKVGVLIVPTERFSRTLCAVGRRRAVAKGRHAYSGMIHVEKVRRELAYLSFMLNMPIAITGIGIHGDQGHGRGGACPTEHPVTQ